LRAFWTADFASDSDYVKHSLARSQQLEAVMSTDRLDTATPDERGWDVPVEEERKNGVAAE